MNDWLGLTIGNSRLNWGLFKQDNLTEFGSCHHLSTIAARDTLLKQIGEFSQASLPIYLASVVPQQTKLWLDYPRLSIISIADIPVNNLYHTLGVDRALGIYSAGETYGYPALVIDGGTALTFTGVDDKRSLVGGAILPGLRSQLSFLQQHTAALPQVEPPQSLPDRWNLTTETAIASGVVHTLAAGIQSFIADWHQRFPQSQIILTGGDSNLLWQYLSLSDKAVSDRLIVDRHLVLQALKSLQKPV